jgi:hypothetical protein
MLTLDTRHTPEIAVRKIPASYIVSLGVAEVDYPFGSCQLKVILTRVYGPSTLSILSPWLNKFVEVSLF